MSGCHSRSEQPAISVSYLQKEAELFVKQVLNYQTSFSPAARQAVEKTLRESFSRNDVPAMTFLLQAAKESTVRHFAYTHLFSVEASQHASVSVVILKNPQAQAYCGWGNMGRFLIHTQKGEEEKVPLHFTNQASAVYYLMFLIHRLQGANDATPVVLRKNRETFIQLYHQVYDIADVKLRERVKRLLIREVDGKCRVGRQNILLYDIRQHLEAAFKPYNENFQPYAMTARTHLSIPTHLIRFEGEAKRLLDFKFV